MSERSEKSVINQENRIGCERVREAQGRAFINCNAMLLQCLIINKYYGVFNKKSFSFMRKDFANASNSSKKYIFVPIHNTQLCYS